MSTACDVKSYKHDVSDQDSSKIDQADMLAAEPTPSIMIDNRRLRIVAMSEAVPGSTLCVGWLGPVVVALEAVGDVAEMEATVDDDAVVNDANPVEEGTTERDVVEAEDLALEDVAETVFDVASNELELTLVVDNDWEVAEGGLKLVPLAEIERPDGEVSAAAAT